jgi:hypothetical protein
MDFAAVPLDYAMNALDFIKGALIVEINNRGLEKGLENIPTTDLLPLMVATGVSLLSKPVKNALMKQASAPLINCFTQNMISQSEELTGQQLAGQLNY